MYDPMTTAETAVMLLHRYGPAVVILAIFITVFMFAIFLIMRQQQKTNDKMMEEHRELMTFLINTHSISSREMTSSAAAREVLKVYHKAGSELKILISELSGKIKPNRIGIYLLHNGTNSLSGFPFLKVSCVCEFTKNPRYSKTKNHINIPVGIVSDFLNILISNISLFPGCPWFSDINKDPVFVRLIGKLDNYICHAILSVQGSVLLGFVLIEFDNRTAFNVSEQLGLVGELTKKLAPILEFSEYNNLYGKESEQRYET